MGTLLVNESGLTNGVVCDGRVFFFYVSHAGKGGSCRVLKVRESFGILNDLLEVRRTGLHPPALQGQHGAVKEIVTEMCLLKNKTDVRISDLTSTPSRSSRSSEQTTFSS